MKKIFKTLILFILAFIFINLNINVFASTSDVYNFVTCPGEDMATQMQVSWQSNTTITNLKVEYTLATDTTFTNSKKINGEYRSFSRQDNEPFEGTTYIGFSSPRYVWNVLIDELTPKTKYIYRIVDDNKIYSNIYNFETASKDDEEFSFLFITDPQYEDDEGAKIFNKITERHINNDDIKFALVTGDICNKAGISDLWDMFYTKSSIQKIPFATTVGNHDYYDSKNNRTDNYIFNSFFNNPKNGPEHVKGSSYYFIYNQALFIMLDSEEKYNTEEQKEWFRAVCNSIDCSYIIVGCHKTAYAAGPYVSLGKTFIAEWGPVFDECQVDLVLSGHDHVFSRTKSLVNGEPTTEKYKGTVYIEGGAAGPKYYAIQSEENADKWDAVVEKRICGTVITLGKETYSTATYSQSGALLDSSTNYRKRIGTYDNTYTKEEFENSFNIQVTSNDLKSGEISWSEKGYGLVRNLKITHLNSGNQLDTVNIINDITTSANLYNKLWLGDINEFKIDILYKDGTTNSINLSVDNSINWGSINSATAVNIQSRTFTLLLNLSLNTEYDYIKRIVILENDVVKTGFVISKEQYSLNEIEIKMSNKFMEPDTTHTYEIRALNINGNIAWSSYITVTSERELTTEQEFQNNIANLAFKTMIDNLLKALTNDNN